MIFQTFFIFSNLLITALTTRFSGAKVAKNVTDSFFLFYWLSIYCPEAG
jgi:hypothetical protein